MKISEGLEQLALYNLQKRAEAGQVDVTAEKLKRFNTILDLFTGGVEPFICCYENVGGTAS